MVRISKTFVTVDVVLLKPSNYGNEVLLIERKKAPFKGAWALPGGFVEEHEDLADAAKRELFEETAIRLQQIEQLRAFGKPHRDPRGHMVSVAFVAFADDSMIPKAGDDAADAKWFSVNDLPKLAFDHAEIISFALAGISDF